MLPVRQADGLRQPAHARTALKLEEPLIAWPVFPPHIIEPSPSPVKRVPGLKRPPGFRCPASGPMTAEASPESAGVRPCGAGELQGGEHGRG
ncbi:MAG TPA: hypothetical protein VH643_17295 [Gemmataceae bacterium]